MMNLTKKTLFFFFSLCLASPMVLANPAYEILPTIKIQVWNDVSPDNTDSQINGIVFEYEINIQTAQTIEGFTSVTKEVQQYKSAFYTKNGVAQLPSVTTQKKDFTYDGIEASIRIQGYQCPNTNKIVPLAVYSGCNIVINETPVLDPNEEIIFYCQLSEGGNFGNTIHACQDSK